MKIKLQNNIFEKEIQQDFFIPYSFRIVGKKTYFIAECINNYLSAIAPNKDYYSAIEISKQNNILTVTNNIVILIVDNENNFVIGKKPLEAITNELIRKNVWYYCYDYLFITLRNERDKVNVVFNHSLLKLLIKVIKDYSYKVMTYKTIQKLEVVIFNTFAIVGYVEGEFENGGVYLTSVNLIEIHSNMIVLSLGNIELEAEAYIENDELEEYLNGTPDSELTEILREALQYSI